MGLQVGQIIFWTRSKYVLSVCHAEQIKVEGLEVTIIPKVDGNHPSCTYNSNPSREASATAVGGPRGAEESERALRGLRRLHAGRRGAVRTCWLF